jgi:hypothetical protein
VSKDGVSVVLIHKQRFAAYRPWVLYLAVCEDGSFVGKEEADLNHGGSEGERFSFASCGLFRI